MAITAIFQSVYLRVKYILETRDSIVVAYLLPQTPLVKKVGEVDSLVSRPPTSACDNFWDKKRSTTDCSPM